VPAGGKPGAPPLGVSFRWGDPPGNLVPEPAGRGGGLASGRGRAIGQRQEEHWSAPFPAAPLGAGPDPARLCRNAGGEQDGQLPPPHPSL